MAVFLAILAALAFALGSVLQQRGALETTAAEGDLHFLAQILRRPVWFLGAGCQALGWVLQAAALGHGTLVIVQSLCALSLVFALPLGARLTRQRVDGRAITGALLTLTGIVVFVALAQPADGTAHPPAAAWWWSGIGSVLAIAGLAAIGRQRGGAIAAAAYAAAAGVCFAYQAAVTKVFVTDLGHGIAAVLATWTTYALILTALGGFVLQQSALKTGYLAPALAASNATTLVISVVLGVLIFDETLTNADGHRGLALGALVVSAVGIVVLATPTPARSSGSSASASHVL